MGTDDPDYHARFAAAIGRRRTEQAVARLQEALS